MKRTIFMVCSVMLFLCGIYCNEIYCEETNETKIEKYTQEIEKNPNKASGYINRAEVYNDDRKYDLALKDIDVALKLDIDKKDKEKALDQRIRANFYKKINEEDKNITKEKIFKDINELTILNPKNPKIYYRKGQYYCYIENKYNISISFFDKAISLIKDDNNLLGYAIYNRFFGYFNLYNINKNKIFYDKVIEDCSFIINNLSNDIDIETLQICYFYRALLYNFDSKTEKLAFDDYSSAIKIGKNETILSQSYYYRSKIYYSDNMYREAIEDTNKFHELLNNKDDLKKANYESEYIDSLYWLAECYYKLQEYNNAITEINLCIDKTDSNSPTRKLFVRGDSYFNIGEYDLALKDFEEILKFNIDAETKKFIPEKIKQVKQKKKEKQLKKVKTEVFSEENIEF